MDEAGENPVRGVQAREFLEPWVRSTRLAWGVSDLATGGTDSLTGVGDPRHKSEGREKLNHERPARACQSLQSETVPNREHHTPRDNRTLLVSVRRNHLLVETMPGGDAETYGVWPVG